MSELIDREALRAAHGLGTDCATCKQNARSCQYDRDFSLMDFCEWIDDAPTAYPWHRVEEPPRDGQECIVAYSGPTDWIYEHATYHSDLNKALEEDIFIDGTDGFIVDGDVGYDRHSFNYWMPIEPPKEDA